MRPTIHDRPRIDVQAFKARFSIEDVVSRHVTLRPAGREKVGLCPFHDERSPSFRVNDDKGTYHCFGCGASGDILTFIQEKDGLSFIDAVRQLDSGALPEIDPRERDRRRAEERAERMAAIADAVDVWERGVDPAGTPAETYIRKARLIGTVAIPPSIRFAMTWARKDRETGEVGPDHPAMICAVQNAGGRITGLQRIFLAPDGSAKAPWKRAKLSLGIIKGGAIRLGPVAPEIVICEGPEDGLTLAQLYGQTADRSVWVACGTEMMGAIVMPAGVQRVTLAGDNNAAGRKAVEAAAEAYRAQNLAVRAVFPTEGFKDFNDELRGVRM